MKKRTAEWKAEARDGRENNDTVDLYEHMSRARSMRRLTREQYERLVKKLGLKQ